MLQLRRQMAIAQQHAFHVAARAALPPCALPPIFIRNHIPARDVQTQEADLPIFWLLELRRRNAHLSQRLNQTLMHRLIQI